MKLWLLWVLASTVAFGIGGRVGLAWSPSRDLIVIAYLGLAASMILAGVLQWLVLRGLIAHAGAWLLANVAATAAVGALAFGLGLINRDAGWVLGVAGGWIVLGVLQWLVLREQLVGAGWWVLASTLGLIVAGPVVGFVSWATGAPGGSLAGGLSRWLAFGAAYGAITGTALVWLLRQRLA